MERIDVRSIGIVVIQRYPAPARFDLTLIQNAGHISRLEEPDQDFSRSHRHSSLQAALQHDCHPADRVLVDRHHATVRGESYRLHSQQGSARGRVEHLLLDPQHLHDHRRLQEARGFRGALPWRRQLKVPSREREEGVQVLSVGLLHAVSSGDPLLHAPLVVERLGGWKDPRVDDGPRHRPLLRGGEEAEEKDAARLSVGKSSLSQLVGLQVLPLRSSRPGECGRFLESDQEDRVDPMIYVFPRMTKCTFYKYGVSGEVERHDAVCILPLNVVNEKIYVFLWFWFLFLGVLSFITVLYRIVIIFSPRTRVYLLRLRFRLVRREAVETIVRRSKVGDWFLLYMLGENLDTVIYRDVMHELASKLASRHHHSVPGIKGELQEA
ncbi:uncharacterized protein LOC128896721 isoform X2 [Hylaeus anthracinus]|uniref:uncharacterized protein LOC128896721 isoform X2 n=1 Tax=Hylaeus anthracinus TaxID=313031 RepID=UPI0023B9592B|nr:uncharacterized protein LOC128896721 isoform X2 [Hylaeus anthracinus]